MTEDRLNVMWKRTIFHWLFACVGATGVVIYLLFHNSDGKGLTPLSALGVMAIVVVATILFIIATGAIKNLIGGRYRQRKDR